MTSGRTLQAGGSAEVTAMHGLLVEVYADAYAHRVATGNPFASSDAIAERLERHRARPGFSRVGAWSDGELVGHAYGQRPDPRYWLGDELADAREPFAGMVLFVTNELMVRQAWRDQGVGRLLHDALVGEQQDTTLLGLYVRPDNDPAVHLYTKFGYERIGPRQLGYEGFAPVRRHGPCRREARLSPARPARTVRQPRWTAVRATVLGCRTATLVALSRDVDLTRP